MAESSSEMMWIFLFPSATGGLVAETNLDWQDEQNLPWLHI